jgi:hypothetical protein
MTTLGTAYIPTSVPTGPRIAGSQLAQEEPDRDREWRGERISRTTSIVLTSRSRALNLLGAFHS